LSDYTCAGNTSITGDNKIILYGTAEANSIVTLSINGVPKTNITVDSTGNWVYDNSASILPDNVYLFTAITTDSAGNVSDFSNQFNISINTADNDTDGNPDFCDDDDDNDGVLDGDDNSPLIPNPGQEDTDGDGVADVDEDCDNDGIINYYDTDNSDCTTTIAQKKKYGFSPNGDGINDNWTIDNIELYPSNVVKVYNRSGRLVYRAYGYKNTWNGIS
ncbi:MAG: gliding motility-associated C-terminal domain-containing protein, partial [Flavobacteriaceae bacterium]